VAKKTMMETVFFVTLIFSGCKCDVASARYPSIARFRARKERSERRSAKSLGVAEVTSVDWVASTR
jgi:hypothetical protein